MARTKPADIADLLGQAVKSARFCVTGCLDDVDPELQVKGLGKLQLPLSRKRQAELIKRCKTAPYGKGTRTLVNRNVRDTFELNPSRFTLGEAWQETIDALLPDIARGLGIEDGTLEAQLYKLLVYQTDGFFLPHKDSEKCDGMVASLVVVLSNPFQGGELVVQHGGAARTIAFEQAAAGRQACYAAFFADCSHEVQRVRGGPRLCLTYNLVLKRRPGRRSRSSTPSSAEQLAVEHLNAWRSARPGEPLVFALSHQYTERSLSLPLLKGADHESAALLIAAAKNADCCVYFAHVTRHLLQDAFDGSEYGRRSRYGYWDRETKIENLELGDIHEDELVASQLFDVRGRKQPWGNLPLDVDNIVSLEPIDQWKPTEEAYEGYTGNAGNTLDRWYHRSAVLVWHRDDHYEVIARAGVTGCIAMLEEKLAQLPALAEKSESKFDEEHADCVRLARAIVSQWPSHYGGWEELSASLKSFPQLLLQLYDQETIARFLEAVAQKDVVQPLAELIVDASREFGWDAFAVQLRGLLNAEQPRFREPVSQRDARWLAAYCTAPDDDHLRKALAVELCTRAIDIFCRQQNEPSYATWNQRGGSTVESEIVIDLFKAVCGIGADDLQQRLVDYVMQAPGRFTPDDCQVPCLVKLVPWTRRRFDQLPASLQQWLDSLTRQLEEATRSEPQPPTDWSRPAEVDDGSEYGRQLNAFLADPSRETDSIAAPEHGRQGLVSLIDRHRCDVTHRLVKQGRPYSLKLTKTTGSYNRALKRYRDDLKLLSKLNRLKPSP